MSDFTPYSSMPPMPPGGPDGGPAGAPPLQVVRAAWCLYGLAAIQVVATLASLLSTDGSREAIRENDPSLTESEIATFVALGLVFAAVFALLFAGAYVLFGRKLLAGRSWARNTATVLTGLVIVLDLLSLGGRALTTGGNALTAVITVVGLVLAIAFLVLAWSRASNEFFAAARVAR